MRMEMLTAYGRRKVSDILAVAAMALLLTYIADAAVGQANTGFLPMSEVERGMILGLPSILLFLAAFGIGYKEKTWMTTTLLIAGGLLMGTSVLVASALAEGGLSTIPGSFLAVIVIGYIIMGLGILRAIQRK